MEVETLLQEGEEVIVKARKHFMVYVEDVFIHSAGCMLLIVVASFFVGRGGLSEIITMLSFMFVILFYSSFFYAWTKNYFDVWHITNKHIIAVNQRGILDREVSYMEYNRIQDVFFEKEGLIGTFFGYGRLKVQTAGSDQSFVIENITKVEEVAEIIIRLRDEANLSKSSII